MDKKLFLKSALLAVTTLAAAFMGPVVQADIATESNGVAAAAPIAEVKGEGITAAELTAEGQGLLAPPPGGWNTPSQRSYYLLPSCDRYASAIQRGASAWNGLSRGGGTPVECRNSYISDCGQGGRIVGCNWGRGQRIALYMGGVSDDALLAAHEFGHDWYGHSRYRCAGWSSPAEVMAPSMCGYAGLQSIDGGGAH